MNDLDAACALRQDSKVLAHFIVPLSPSDAAPHLGMAANLAHHHARKLVDVGLLFEQSREGGKVLYQLAAREFRLSSDLLPPEDEAGNGSATLRGLSAGFLQAYERSWRNMNEGQEAVYGFGTTERPAHPGQLPYPVSDEPYPTHADTLTLRLTPERFRRLARALSALSYEAQAEGVHEEGAACTLAVLAFRAEPSQPQQLSPSSSAATKTVFWAGTRWKPGVFGVTRH